MEKDDQPAALALDQILTRPLDRRVSAPEPQGFCLEKRNDETVDDVLVLLLDSQGCKYPGLSPDKFKEIQVVGEEPALP